MTPLRRNLLTVGIYGVVVVLFTWPLVTAPTEIAVSRQFDLYGMLWLIDAAHALGTDLRIPLAAWPLGQPVFLVDSALLLAVAWLLPDGTNPLLLASLFALMGPVLSAWAAERLAARCLGAVWPWSLLAGLVYGFSGVAATALLEGQLYTLLNPWLPLLAWSGFLATEREAKPRHGLAMGGAWVLCLLTSAYVGVCATLLVGMLLVRGMRRHTLRLRPLALAAGIALPAGLLYCVLVSFSTSRGLPGWEAYSSFNTVETGSAALADLVTWTPASDVRQHSTAPTLGFTALCMVLFAPVVLRRRGRWRGLMMLAVVSLLLALGPTLRLTRETDGLPWLLYPIAATRLGAWFRFPLRLLWLTALGFGCTAAVMATRLARDRPRMVAPLLFFALADALLLTGAPFRTARVPISVPSAYQALPEEGAILDLMPEFHGWSANTGHHILDFTCTYQREHGHPLLNACLQPLFPQGPQVPVGRWLQHNLLASEIDVQVSETLAELGIGAVVVHPVFFPRSSRVKVLDSLEALLGPPLAESHDAGEYVRIYAVPAEVSRLSTSSSGVVRTPRQALFKLREAGW